MSSSSSLSYLLAIALKELFPDTEIQQIQATDVCFFCDLIFPGVFNPTMISLLEERMRSWIAKKESFQSFDMIASNAAQFLDHHGEKELSQIIRKEQGLVSLLQLDRFFFKMMEKPPGTTADVPFCKLVCFWPLKQGIRILGVGAASKDILKEKAQALKAAPDIQRKLESFNLISWIDTQIIWESQAETLKDSLEKKITQLYRDFDRLFIPVEGEIKKILRDWMLQRKRKGFQFQKNKLSSVSLEPWDTIQARMDLSWGRLQDVNSFLHIITKFLTIFSFDYEVIYIGRPVDSLEKALRAHQLSWIMKSGKSIRVEFQVKDSLGRKWPMSSLEWDQKQELLMMTLCSSFERCIALIVEKMDIETILNRLKSLEN